MSSRRKDGTRLLTRREILKDLALTPAIFRAAPLFAGPLLAGAPSVTSPEHPGPLFADLRLIPHYPAKSPLAGIFALVAPGSDSYITEKYADEICSILKKWSDALKAAPTGVADLAESLDQSIEASTLVPVHETVLRSAFGIHSVRRQFTPDLVPGRDRLIEALRKWLAAPIRIDTAEFEIFAIEQVAGEPLAVRADIRYDLVSTLSGARKEERVGSWRTEWVRTESNSWKARKWELGEETAAIAKGPVFIDVTAQALGKTDSYHRQLLHGADYWRTLLDGAIGVDLYCNNGIAVGDFDNDGFDDFYVCQPAGLPNRLFRNRGDGTFEDVTEKSGVGILDSTACALFADFQNQGLQDLLVVCGTGPLLYLNQGNGTFRLKRDAFRFARQPQGTFTHAAIADYDRDGRLDVYFCMYMYYLGLDQYHYPVPYYDARNGPPNCLFHNEGNATFVETTEAAGLNRDNDRYTFACAWGDAFGNGPPDLFVSNDFGTSQLYRNNGDGTFKVVSAEAGVEGVGAGMGCCWCDFDNDGHQDVYVPSMWEAAGQRVSEQKQFHAEAPERIRELYRRHARGNALYRNKGDGTFENVGHTAGVEMGRWSWSADFFDFDHDGYSDLYVSNGYISAPDKYDLASFFWRQVVAKSPEDATAASAYERGWNAINELVRSDRTWHGYARNVMFANNHDGTFSEISGPAGLDLIEDSRSFALADIDHDGRLEVLLKNRNAPQLRILRNALQEIGASISFRLRGTKSNRDAIGAALVVETGTLRQTKFLQAGTGFLAQHSKELFFGLGSPTGKISVTIQWPSGLTQHFDDLPANHRIQIEEASNHFDAAPFASPPAIYAHPAPPPPPEQLPQSVGTWLVEPLKAPEFSSADANQNVHQLSSYQGRFVLLNFWSAANATCLEQLRQFQQRHPAMAAASLVPLAVNVETDTDAGTARSLAQKERFSFPVLFASAEVAGIYNIIYRHLFDRRRDLPLPISFLLDRQGSIVKIYQGRIAVDQVFEDLHSLPSTAAERMRKALPFQGMLVQDAFRRNDFTYGVAMYQHGYLDQAEASFLQVIATNPENADAYYNLGTLRLGQNDFTQARQYLEETLRLKPDFPEAWNNLGMIAAQQGQPDEAVSDFQKSLALRPEYATALLNLGNVYRRQQDFQNAQKCFDGALRIQPDNPEVNYSLGMLYAQQGQLQQASGFLEKAIALRPDYAEALNNLGVLFVRDQNFPRAEEQFKAGIRVAPQYDQPYLNLARLYVLQNNRQKAREILLQLLRVQPRDAAAQQALEMLQ
ncbi:MAG TPA: tetratricopeptide repeat protein [Terracidiphilus sp.]|nr:tetratricopeptide repeat protein [Terracidiphilus sp.]